MNDIISWYVWWQKTEKSKDKKPKIIEAKQIKEFTNPKALTRFEEGKINEGYETGHGYYLNIT